MLCASDIVKRECSAWRLRAARFRRATFHFELGSTTRSRGSRRREATNTRRCNPLMSAKNLVAESQVVYMLAILVVSQAFPIALRAEITEDINRNGASSVTIRRSTEIAGSLFTIIRATYSPDGRYVAFLGSRPAQPSSFAVDIYDAHGWRLVETFAVPTMASFGTFDGGLSFSPDSQYIAFGMDKLFIRRIADQSLSIEIDGPYSHGDWAAAGLLGLDYSPDGSSIAVLYNDVFWPAGKAVNTRADAVAIMENARASLFAKENPVTTREPVIMAFDVRSGKSKFSAKLYGINVQRYSVTPTASIAYTRDGFHIIASGLEYPPIGSRDGEKFNIFLAFLRSDNGKLDHSILDVHAGLVTAFSTFLDGRTIATGTSTGLKVQSYDAVTHSKREITNQDNIRIWDIPSGRHLRELGPIHGPTKKILVPADGRRVISCQPDESDGSVVKIWSLEDGQLLGSYGLSHEIHNQFFTCAISPDGHTVVVPELGKGLAGRALPDKLHVMDIR